MARRTLALCLVAGMALPQQFASAQSSPADVDLATGIRQVREGDFDTAVITLDGVVRRIAAQKGQAKDLGRAYTYLAIAYVGLAQQETAKAKFLEAWKADKSMTLSPKEFPPNIIDFFDQAKKEGETKAAAEAKPPSTTPKPAPSAVATTEAKKGGGGGGKTALIVVGALAAAGGIALAAKGGSSPPPPPTTLTPPAATLSDLSATVVSPQFNMNLNCTDNVFVTVMLTNRARSSVAVTGVRSDSTVTSGGCFPSPRFVYTPLTSSVGPGSTVPLLNQPIFTGGSGCCRAGSTCSGFCQFQQAFTVTTSVGELNAGAIGFGVTFKGCVVCSSSAAQTLTLQCQSAPD